MISIITARGGSKGLPGKNIRPFLGIPLIAHTIQAARASRHIHRVVVSTDCHEIAKVSRDYGAETPFMRPDLLATDSATSRDVVLHALYELKSPEEDCVQFCLLQPTSPLRHSKDIDAAIELFRMKDADATLSMVQFEHPPQWAMTMDDAGQILPTDGSSFIRRQDLKRLYRPNGAIYVYKTSFYKQSTGLNNGKQYAYLMPAERSYDIDSLYDFIAAESIAKHVSQNNENG